MDEEDGQGSSRESECGGEKAKEFGVWRHLMMRESGVGPHGTESPDG